jgi:hypothetical protein
LSVFGSLCALLLWCLFLAQSTYGAGVDDRIAPFSTARPLKPFVYAMASSGTSFDLMLSNGIGKDLSVSKIKVDGVFFSETSGRLSADGRYAAVRIVGDRTGGSTLLLVDVKTGKQTPITSTRSTAAGFGTYLWSPAGNTLAFVRSTPALAAGFSDDAHGEIYLFSVGFQPMRLAGSNGSDRLLAFSDDGNGVYASRKEKADNITLEHLVYVPLSGGPAVTLFRSTPTLRYYQFAIWSKPGAPAKVAYLAEGTFATGAPGTTSLPPTATALAHPNPSPTLVPPTYVAASASTAASATVTATAQLSQPVQPAMFNVLTKVDVKLSRPNKVGLVISDLGGTWPGLMREDAQPYPYMTWTLDGKSLIMGGSRSSGSWMVNMNAEKQAISTSLYGLRVQTWSEDGTQVVLADSPTSRLVTLDVVSGQTVATRDLGGFVKSGTKYTAPALKLAVPYIHQVIDVSPYGDGNWACGPTSVAMALAYYGRLEPWYVYQAREQAAAPNSTPATIPAAKSPDQVRGADYAPYISNEYTHGGHTYSVRAADPQGNMLAGLYGTICPYGLAEWQMMTSVISRHGLGSQYLEVSFDSVVAALKRGHPVIMGTQLTSEGHILLAIGYTADGNLIVNDPYGNRFEPGYGGNNGRGVYYPWKDLTARRALEVLGNYAPPPTFVPPMAPLPSRPDVEETATPTAGEGTAEPITATLTPTSTGLFGADTPTPLVTETPTVTVTVTATPAIEASPTATPSHELAEATSTSTPVNASTAVPTAESQPTHESTQVAQPTQILPSPTEPGREPAITPQVEQPTSTPRLRPESTPRPEDTPTPERQPVPVPTSAPASEPTPGG